MRCDRCGKFKKNVLPEPHKTQWAAMNDDPVMLCDDCRPSTDKKEG